MALSCWPSAAVGRRAADIGGGELRIEPDRVGIGGDGRGRSLPGGQGVALLDAPSSPPPGPAAWPAALAFAGAFFAAAPGGGAGPFAVAFFAAAASAGAGVAAGCWSAAKRPAATSRPAAIITSTVAAAIARPLAERFAIAIFALRSVSRIAPSGAASKDGRGGSGGTS